jgi:hypothetical protein
MKRFLLMSIVLLFCGALAVGSENSLDKKEASLQFVVKADGLDIQLEEISNYSIDCSWAATGEIIPDETPEVLYADIVMPVETEPPIYASANVLTYNSRLPDRNCQELLELQSLFWHSQIILTSDNKFLV